MTPSPRPVHLAWLAPLLLVLAACGGAPPTPPISLDLSLPAGDIRVGDVVTAVLVVDADAGVDEGVTWSSSDEAVFTVDQDGVLTALAEGSAELVVTSVAFPDVSDELTVDVAPHPLSGRRALYYVDLGGDDIVGAALDTASALHGLTVVRPGYADFLDELDAGSDLVVYLTQDGDPSLDHTEALVDWVQAGGYLVFTNWNVDNDNAAAVLAAMESGFDGTENYASFVVTDAALLTDLSSSELALTNTGWGVYSVGLTLSGEAEALATFDDGEVPAMVSGNGGRTVALGFLSDVVPAVDGEVLFLNLFSKMMR